MGSILGSEVSEDGKVIFEVMVDKAEALQMQGHLDNVHVFSGETDHIKSRISFRGKNEATKYFLIPREMREDITKNKEVKCQVLETKDETIYIYHVNKNKN